MRNHVFFIGLGLIGGSLAMAIKKEHPSCKITGLDIDPEQAQLAVTLGVIDEAVSSIEEGAREADCIILSAPVQQTLLIMSELSRLPLKKQVIITDVGSTKETIDRHAKKVFSENIIFIGGHPMAGSHKSGVSAAKAHLFENAFYVLCHHLEEHKPYAEELKNLFSGTKANFVTMTPKEHDLVTGVISHFPHIVAAGLVHQAVQHEEEYPLTRRLAAGGFRDITRIASSSPEMWRDILLQNKEHMLKLLEQWMKEMEHVRHLIREEDGAKILTYFYDAKEFRDGLPVKQQGAIPSFYDLYIDVPDYPGVISEITGYLAKESISITNIRIIETREDINGVLRISFQREADRERAKTCIAKYTNYGTFFG
ncbi:prephenate dehydrogenase [Bacillus sp. FJAT-42376]|uniref:prephenate dehydrogenase n=1 Tax=Bacillus sp. FJAT-42376 TaxID=2014076 RepID=UPI000F4EC63A|nr:prephenate dehydrogenase [Bacillus sp. FJAT-42376]AZB43326.1 prephenate dehydrogenase [Bacillus sp. FJAT-42376]